MSLATNHGPVNVCLKLRAYDDNDQPRDVTGPVTPLVPGDDRILEWQLPELDGQPIAEIGLAVAVAGKRPDGTLLLDYLRWDGAPTMTLRHPGPNCGFWRLAWVNGTDFFPRRFPPSSRISQSHSEGLIARGTRR